MTIFNKPYFIVHIIYYQNNHLVIVNKIKCDLCWYIEISLNRLNIRRLTTFVQLELIKKQLRIGTNKTELVHIVWCVVSCDCNLMVE